MVYFKKIAIQGLENKTVYDDGLESSKENPTRLLSIIAQIGSYMGNDIQGWWEREKIFELRDSLIDTTQEGTSQKFAKSFNRLNEIEVGMDLPVGSTFKVALKCAGSPDLFYGAYRYEIVK
ncbi:hypothetical protein ES702_06761 [subsurface metagenome]